MSYTLDASTGVTYTRYGRRIEWRVVQRYDDSKLKLAIKHAEEMARKHRIPMRIFDDKKNKTIKTFGQEFKHNLYDSVNLAPTNKAQPIDPHTAGLKRKLLPQIPKKQMGKFVRLLKGQGIGVKAKMIPACKLKPVQQHLSKEKIKEMQPAVHDLAKDPFIVSKEYRIIDGHHRWALAKENNKHYPLRTIVVDLPIKELILAGHKFEGSFTKGL